MKEVSGQVEKSIARHHKEREERRERIGTREEEGGKKRGEGECESYKEERGEGERFGLTKEISR